MRPSPQPTASRLFTVLLTVLLVSSLAAPFVAGPAVADDGDTFAYYCEPFEVGITDPMCERTTSAVSSDETIMHSTARTEAEGVDSHNVMLDNHLEDTSTIASLEARNAIAESWENGDSEAEAYQNALEAIRDYYAIHQENHVQQMSKTQVQMANVAHAAHEDDEIIDDWISMDANTDANNNDEELYLNGSTHSSEVELLNGETTNATFAVGHFSASSSYSGSSHSVSGQLHLNFAHPDDYSYDGENFQFPVKDDPDWLLHFNNNADRDFGSWTTDGKWVIPNVGDAEDGGLPSEMVFDAGDWKDRWLEIEEQSDQAVANYDSEFVGALYDELDAGNLDPEEVRGAEGMARYLSGDSDVTDQRFRLALMQMGGMSNPDLAGTSSMTVEYEGYTDITYNGTDSDTREAEFSEYTDDTFEGLLFASEVPDGGFTVNQSYAIGDVNTTGTALEPVNGSAQIFNSTAGETTHFYEGTFTVTEMYDADGEQVETVEWDEPKYDTYNASEFAAYIEEVQDLREAINEQAGDGGDGISIGLPDFEDIETGEAIVGLVVIVFVAMAIIGLVTDFIPWL